MKKLLLMCVCLAVVCSTTNAEEYEYGPFNNYEGLEERYTGVTIPMTGEVGFWDPIGGKEYTISSKGGATYWIEYAVPIFSATYYGFETEAGSPFDPNVDSVTLTDVIAKNTQPGHDPCEIPELTGFDAGDPQIVLLSGGAQTGGWYEGMSGTIYHADVCAVTLSDLSSVMDGYDVSKFTGDGDSTVYVQQAVIAANDLMPFVFTFDYKGYVEEGDPCWVSEYDANYPYQHEWEVNVIQMNPQVPECNDVDVRAPVITPGYVQVIPPEGWSAEAVEIGRYGYTANSSEYGITSQMLLGGFKVNAYKPDVDAGAGVVILTYEDRRMSGYASVALPKGKPKCGDWGYAAGDVDQDCDVDLADFSLFAQKWLGCTDPLGQDCDQGGIIGAGFVFDGGDTTGPARVLYLYDDLNADILEANDIIVEYRGTEVSDGNELLTAILAMDDVNAGETISMTIERDDIQLAVEPQVSLQWAGFTSAVQTVLNARCAYQGETSDQLPIAVRNCRCVTDNNTEWCEQYLVAEPYGLGGQVMSLRGYCEDSNGDLSGDQHIPGDRIRTLAK